MADATRNNKAKRPAVAAPTTTKASKSNKPNPNMAATAAETASVTPTHETEPEEESAASAQMAATAFLPTDALADEEHVSVQMATNDFSYAHATTPQSVKQQEPTPPEPQQQDDLMDPAALNEEFRRKSYTPGWRLLLPKWNVRIN